MTFSEPDRTAHAPSHQGPALLETDLVLYIIYHHISRPYAILATFEKHVD